MLPNIHELLQKDPFLLKDARGVAFPRYWYELAGNGEVLWGEYKSKRVKCQTTVDLRHEKVAFQCSCRSRKNPCKHGLALIILLMEYNEAFTVVPELPEEVQKWLKRRDQRILPKNRTEEEEAELAALRKKNYERRLKQMAKGLEELEIWLHDILRTGLATLPQQKRAYWENWQAKLVDAKMKGISKRFEYMQTCLKEENWYELILAEIGDIYLMVKGFRNLEQLPIALQQELFTVIGVNTKKQEVLENQGIEDEWCVLALQEGEEERLVYQRCWLYGKQSNQFALHLDFAWGSEPFAIEWQVGNVVQGELVYYPSSYPQRALFRTFQLTKNELEMKGSLDFASFKAAYAQAVSSNPWLFQFPVFLENVIPIVKEDELQLLDIQEQVLDCEVSDELHPWQLLAMSGGHPISVFGVWEQKTFLPLAAQKDGRWLDLSVRYERKASYRRW
ncbi:MAG: SWIM zinc finger family protein [Bacteroidota bacterium]